MGSIKREKRVLKLVHPGKHVEVHRKPVRAEEVLRKNPRHCIARPDVFKFPWIVVKPESVLLPGSVFFIVPNHTIYDLLKASITQTISIQSQVQTQNHMHNQLKPEASDVSSFEFRPYYKALKYYEEYRSMDKNGLKSCLRRPNSMRKNLKLKVTFNVEIKKR